MDQQSIDLRKNVPASSGNSVKETINIDRDHYKMLLANYNGCSPFGNKEVKFEQAVSDRIDYISTRKSLTHDQRRQAIGLLNRWIELHEEEK